MRTGSQDRCCAPRCRLHCRRDEPWVLHDNLTWELGSVADNRKQRELLRELLPQVPVRVQLQVLQRQVPQVRQLLPGVFRMSRRTLNYRRWKRRMNYRSSFLLSPYIPYWDQSPQKIINYVPPFCNISKARSVYRVQATRFRRVIP